MFEPDAAAKGLDFQYIDTQYESDVEPIVLMRIVTNIVSNAIKFTSSGKIIMAVRSLNDELSIEVHDTGSGLTKAEFAQAKAQSLKMKNAIKDHVEGQGLGLSIALELAQKHGLVLSLMPNRQRGTSISLKVPKLG